MKQWKYYIAYGSNLNLMQMAETMSRCKDGGTGLLEDYELQFRGRKDNAFATIEQKQESRYQFCFGRLAIGMKNGWINMKGILYFTANRW